MKGGERLEVQGRREVALSTRRDSRLHTTSTALARKKSFSDVAGYLSGQPDSRTFLPRF